MQNVDSARKPFLLTSNTLESFVVDETGLRMRIGLKHDHYLATTITTHVQKGLSTLLLVRVAPFVCVPVAHSTSGAPRSQFNGFQNRLPVEGDDDFRHNNTSNTEASRANQFAPSCLPFVKSNEEKP